MTRPVARHPGKVGGIVLSPSRGRSRGGFILSVKEVDCRVSRLDSRAVSAKTANGQVYPYLRKKWVQYRGECLSEEKRLVRLGPH